MRKIDIQIIVSAFGVPQHRGFPVLLFYPNAIL